VRCEQVAALPKFDTGQYEGCEFSMSGGDAKLTIRFAEQPPFEINFYRTRWHQFTALPNCDAEVIKNAYFRLVEIIESRASHPLSRATGHREKPTSSYATIGSSLTKQVVTNSSQNLACGRTAINALSLEDARCWAHLKRAYGSARDIPGLLQQLLTLPASSGGDEPWFSLWSALAHQGNVYSASFAAVSHVTRALSIAPAKANPREKWGLFVFIYGDCTHRAHATFL
jgi:hypothetical protein